MNTTQKYFSGNWDGHITNSIQLSRKKPVIMAGPCMCESKETALEVARFLKDTCQQLNLNYVFKSSYDKANRTSAQSTRGPGLKKGLQWLSEIKQELNVPILTDVHSVEQIRETANVADIIQIPAFLCKQRELLVEAARSNCVVQIKKGQWISAYEMLDIANFLTELGNPKLTLVERGTCLGYNNLVVDFRNLVEMQSKGHAVVFDATHSTQLPGAASGKSSGLRDMAQALTRAAVAVGVDGVFLEVHPNPMEALSDADTQLNFSMATVILKDIQRLSGVS